MNYFYCTFIIFIWVTDLLFTNGNNSSDFKLTIVHNNDIHSHFEQMDKYGSICNEESAARGECYGGIPRLVTKMKEFKKTGENVIFLNAGDFFQGTLWYTLFKWKVVRDLVNRIPYDAVSLGNHEFDDGVDGLIPFVKNLSFPVLCSNIDGAKAPELQKWLKRSVILEVAGRKIGVIGYVTPETAFLSQPGLIVTFSDEVDAIRKEIEILRKQGAQTMIGLGHSGIFRDQEIAQLIPDLDLIVGGHSHTFLYNGKPPIVEDVPLGPYPVVVTSINGSKPIPVVQDYMFGKYLGVLEVKLNSEGRIVSWSGNPILLDNKTKEDEEILEILRPYKEEVMNKTMQYIGTSQVLLDATYCRLRECNLGNVLTDSLIYKAKKNETSAWGKARIAVWNGGGIRSSIAQGDIKLADVLNVAPFENTINMVEVKGEELYKMMEHSISNYDPSGFRHSGAFLQVAGLKVSYNVTKPVGHRVAELLSCTADICFSYLYKPVIRNQTYQMLISSFSLMGGDGFNISVINNYDTSVLDTDVIIDYIQHNSPIRTGIEERINFLGRKRLGFGLSTSQGSQLKPAPSTIALNSLFLLLVSSVVFVIL